MMGLHEQKIGIRSRKGVREKEGDELGEDERPAKSFAGRNKSECRRYAQSSLLNVFYSIAVAISLMVIVVHIIREDLNGDHGSFAASRTDVENAALLRRFPEFGSRAFEKQCPWAKMLPGEPNCTLLVRPLPHSGSGIADWVSKVASGFLQAQLTGCRLLVDYGENVDLHQVLTTPYSQERRLINWTVPPGFECLDVENCTRVEGPERTQHIPFYRFVYRNTTQPFGRFMERTKFLHLEESLQGFRLENGFACSWGSLFQLAPSATQFEPELFSKILPLVRDPGALVLAIYVRTGLTDRAAKAEQNGSLAIDEHEADASESVKCAQHLEQNYLQDRKGDFSFSKIIWMLVTDSMHLKDYVVKTYSEKEVNAGNKTMQRIVLTTRSRGRHSKPSRNPSMTDVAEAIIDWHLIGESDAVIMDSLASFGMTASIRTNRQVYQNFGKFCSLLAWF
jgi:hypothetical protein